MKYYTFLALITCVLHTTAQNRTNIWELSYQTDLMYPNSEMRYINGIMDTNSVSRMSLIKDLDFFLMLSMFAFYSTYSGYRAIRNKSPRANWLDWIMVTGAVVTCGFMITSGNTILIVFGVIFGLLSISDARDFLTKEPFTIKSKRWLVIHIARMMAAYIATTTAFVVVNLSQQLPDAFGILVWFAPTAIGTPLIFYWVNKYKQKPKEILIPVEINT
jgi:hypothetical protein